MKLFIVCSLSLPLLVPAQPAAPAATTAPAAATAPAAPEVSPDTVVLMVGDQKITRAQFEALIPDNMRAQVKPADRRRMVGQLVDVLALSNEARREKVDQSATVRENVRMQVNGMLANELIRREVYEKPVPDPVLRAYYDKNPGEFEQVTAKHILIRVKGSRVPLRPGEKELTEQEALAKAQDLKKKLDAGADFGTLAKAESDDTGSGANGGQLGTFSHGQMVAEFDKAAFEAPIGKVTDPVKTQFGYHLILVTDKKAQPFDQAKAAITQKMQPDMAKQYVETVKKQYPATIDESYFGKQSGRASRPI
jgi:parvulin-like peptidyl-prolyl isomerase